MKGWGEILLKVRFPDELGERGRFWPKGTGTGWGILEVGSDGHTAGCGVKDGAGPAGLGAGAGAGAGAAGLGAATGDAAGPDGVNCVFGSGAGANLDYYNKHQLLNLCLR